MTTIRKGMTFYDEQNDRYLTTSSAGKNPRCWSCIIEEPNAQGDLVITGSQCFTERELKRFEFIGGDFGRSNTDPSSMKGGERDE